MEEFQLILKSTFLVFFVFLERLFYRQGRKTFVCLCSTFHKSFLRHCVYFLSVIFNVPIVSRILLYSPRDWSISFFHITVLLKTSCFKYTTLYFFCCLPINTQNDSRILQAIFVSILESEVQTPSELFLVEWQDVFC